MLHRMMKVQKDEGHEYNGSYSGKYLDRIAFPDGGIGAGMFCIEGTGAISHMSVRNRPEVFNEPCMFAAISVKGLENGANVLEGQVPEWKKFGQPNSGNGSGGQLMDFHVLKMLNLRPGSLSPILNLKMMISLLRLS